MSCRRARERHSAAQRMPHHDGVRFRFAHEAILLCGGRRRRPKAPRQCRLRARGCRKEGALRARRTRPLEPERAPPATVPGAAATSTLDRVSLRLDELGLLCELPLNYLETERELVDLRGHVEDKSWATVKVQASLNTALTELFGATPSRPLSSAYYTQHLRWVEAELREARRVGLCR